MNRFSRLLSEFSRKKSEASLQSKLNQSVKAPESLTLMAQVAT